MDYKELLNELWRINAVEDNRRYSFEKALSIIQIAREDREFEDENVRITMKRTPDGDIFDCMWKK